MTDIAPIDTTNLDIYGADPLLWSRARDQLAGGAGHFFLSTAGPDGRPHAVGIGALWHDGDLYFVSGPGTRKSRHLAANPACAIAAKLNDMDIVFEGTASRVTDQSTLEAIAARYRAGGWPAEVAGDAFTAPFSAPSAGPPPWYLYRLDYDTVYGVGGADPHGATRWRFAR